MISPHHRARLSRAVRGIPERGNLAQAIVHLWLPSFILAIELVLCVAVIVKGQHL